MPLEIIGPPLFAKDAEGQLLTRIGTAFPDFEVIYTRLPGVHAWQRAGFIDLVNERRAANNLGPLSPEEEERVAARSVDLIIEPDYVLIRPDPARMDLAFAADELLQGAVSKRKIKFLSVSDQRVREAIKRRGEVWRLGGVPKTREAKGKWITGSKVGISGQPIYYYSRITGIRWLTYQEFAKLGRLSDPELARHLREIAEHSSRRNRRDWPEVDFFAADIRRFGSGEMGGVHFETLSSEQLRAKYEQLRQHFQSAVHEVFRGDNLENKPWCERMLSTLFIQGNEAQHETSAGLSPEFFLNVDWLAGGRFEEGEFLFDSVFDEAAANPADSELQHLADPRAKGIILNFIRDYGDLEYINIGCVPESLSLERPLDAGRRGVYLAELKSRSTTGPIRRFIRLQKWSVWEHLEEGKNLLESIQESDEYTDYWLDRRLGCRQLGMNMTRRVFMRRLSEMYSGSNPAYKNSLIRTTYFERDYIPGVATDKLPAECFSRPGFAQRFAELLGITGASSLIVGRFYEGKRTIFDDGDEVLLEDDKGMPYEIMVCDHSGAFGDYTRDLAVFAPDYARPVNRREGIVPDPVAFANTYLETFLRHFLHIQSDYRKRRRAFETLFKHCNYDAGGSFAYRWDCVLKRLDQTDGNALVNEIRSHIHVLKKAAAQAAPGYARQPASTSS